MIFFNISIAPFFHTETQVLSPFFFFDSQRGKDSPLVFFISHSLGALKGSNVFTEPAWAGLEVFVEI